MKRIRNQQELDEVFNQARAVLLKHSPKCPNSRAAYREMEGFVEAHPDVPVYWIDVLEDRPVSDFLAEKTGIRHESPQAVLWQDGKVSWHGSHWRVTRKTVERQLSD